MREGARHDVGTEPAAVRLLNKLTVLGGALALSAAFTATSTGVASADIGGTYRNFGDSECIAASMTSNAITQQLCGTTPGQSWTVIGSAGGPLQIENLDTGLCMNISSFSNGAPVVQVNCGDQRITSFWNVTRVGTHPLYPGPPGVPLLRISSPFANDCLDLEDGRPDVGMPIQVWACNPNTSNQKWYAI
jgi:hypothetical protein